jgi:hypothetical protein
LWVGSGTIALNPLEAWALILHGTTSYLEGRRHELPNADKIFELDVGNQKITGSVATASEILGPRLTSAVKRIAEALNSAETNAEACAVVYTVVCMVSEFIANQSIAGQYIPLEDRMAEVRSYILSAWSSYKPFRDDLDRQLAAQP